MMSVVRLMKVSGMAASVCALSFVTLPESPVPAPARSRSTFEPLATDFSDYIWPTSASRTVTSTFGEYRRSHFHAGIDISAGDISGYPVFASRSGEVARIRIVATGYGKILVIRHRDGYTTSYAHLARFAGPIEDRARQEQLRRECYQVDIRPAPGKLHVEKGQIVAYSGDTGSGSPHLHFELRDPNDNPVNPFLSPGLRTFDNIPPTISRIAVAPAYPSATVNGSSADLIMKSPASGRPTVEMHHDVRVVGGATFSVDVRDRIPKSRFRNGIYRNVLTVDGDTAYAIRFDRLPAGPVQEIGLQYDWELIDEGRGRFQRLFMLTANDLPTYTPRTVPAGIVDVKKYGPGKHRYAVSSSDFSGNTSRVTGEFLLSSEPAFQASLDSGALRVKFASPGEIRLLKLEVRTVSGNPVRSSIPAPGGIMPPELKVDMRLADITAVVLRAENREGILSAPFVITRPSPHLNRGSLRLSAENLGDGVRLILSSDGFLSSAPTVTAFEGNTPMPVTCRTIDEHSAAAWYVPGPGAGGRRRFAAYGIVDGIPREDGTELEFHPLHPGTAGQLRLDGGNLNVMFDSLSLLAPLLLDWSKTTDAGDAIYTLGPGYPVLGGGLRISLRDPQPAPHRALFFRGRGGWTLIGGLDGSDPYSGKLSSTLGEVAIMTDDTPPTIRSFTMEGSHSAHPKLRFRYRDDLSGIEYDSLKTYLDGAVVIADVDGEHRRAAVIPSAPLARGTHRLTIHIADRMGNQATVERSFTVR
jgi:hypothetical protein